MHAPSATERRAALRERARRLRWVLAGAAGAAFAAALGLVVSNPIGTQAQAATPPPTGGTSDRQPYQPGSSESGSGYAPVTRAPQQQPILRSGRS